MEGIITFVIIIEIILAIAVGAKLNRFSAFILTLFFSIFGAIASVLFCILSELKSMHPEKISDPDKKFIDKMAESDISTK